MAFVGIGIEAGQRHQGLNLSSRFARTYLRDQTDYVDYGDINSSLTYKGIFALQDFENFDLSAYSKAASAVAKAHRNHSFVLNWGGDHSIGWSTISGFLSKYPNGKIIWIDAHADLNRPETSLTGNFHGMPVSFLLGLNPFRCPADLSSRLKPEQIIYLGLRSLDPFEVEMIQKLKITAFTMNSIRKNGIHAILSKIALLVGQSPVHVSFDIDSVDPLIAPSTGVPAEAGFSAHETQYISNFISKNLRTKSLDIVEVNPLLGSIQDVEQTYNVAFSFLKSFIPNIGGPHAFKFQSNKGKLSASPKWSVQVSS